MAHPGFGKRNAKRIDLTTDKAIRVHSDYVRKASPPGRKPKKRPALAERIASGDLEQGELSVALEDLDRLVNDNPVDFPEDMRPSLTEDIQSARMAMESEDSEALQEAAASIQATLSGSDAASTAS